jgi:single-strand DNA-binding protein
VAVNRKWTDSKTGEQREKTTWFRVSAWNKLAETCTQYVHKGMRILVSGEVDASAWIGQDGEAKATLELTARDVKFLGSKDGDRANAPEGEEELNDIPF